MAFLYDIYTLLIAQNGKSWNECRIKIEIYPFHTTLMQKPKDIDAKNIKEEDRISGEFQSKAVLYWYPRAESNRQRCFRRALLYPFNYGDI